MKENYATQRTWSDSFNSSIKSVLLKSVQCMIETKVSSMNDDMKNAFDFYFDIKGGIACRVRKTKFLSRFEDLTIRSYVPHNGYNTEYYKIFKENKCKYYLYGWGEDGVLVKWYLVDLDIVRKSGLFRNMRDIANFDGTMFKSVPFDDLFLYNAVIASSHKLPYHKDYVIKNNEIYMIDLNKIKL